MNHIFYRAAKPASNPPHFKPTGYQETVFDIQDDYSVRVSSTTVYERTGAGRLERELVLDAAGDLDIVELTVNGQEYPYRVDKENEKIHIPIGIRNDFKVRCVVNHRPEKNTETLGLYMAGVDKKIVSIQAEPMLWSAVVPSLDRPDIRSKRIITIKAPAAFTLLRAAGEIIGHAVDEDGRQQITFRDDGPKPNYITAILAAEDMHIVTEPGPLPVEVIKEKEKKDSLELLVMTVRQAVAAIKKIGFPFDYKKLTFSLIPRFAYNGMENDELITLEQDRIGDITTKTDGFLIDAMDLAAHEVGHYIAGNDVTISDFDNLAVKEQLTTYIAHETIGAIFGEDYGRIFRAKFNRSALEYHGPNHQPVLGFKYKSPLTLYSPVALNESSAKFESLRGLLDREDIFHEALESYYMAYRGRAASMDQFLAHMERFLPEDAEYNLTEDFRTIYEMQGSPRVSVEWAINGGGKATITLRQDCPRDADGRALSHYPPVPVKVAFVTGRGVIKEDTLILTGAERSFEAWSVPADAVLSVNREYATPLPLETDYKKWHLLFLAKHETDLFARWDALQKLTLLELKKLHDRPGERLDRDYIRCMSELLRERKLPDIVRAEMFTPPSKAELESLCHPADPFEINRAYADFRALMGKAMGQDFENEYTRIGKGHVTGSPADMGARLLRSAMLTYMDAGTGPEDRPALEEKMFRQYTDTKLEQEREDARSILLGSERYDGIVRQQEIARHSGDARTVQNSFSFIAPPAGKILAEELRETLETGKHGFNIGIPRHIRMLAGAITGNAKLFHADDGLGYELFADLLIKMGREKRSPIVAQFISAPLKQWWKYDEDRANLMIMALRRVEREARHPVIAEIAEQGLRGADEYLESFGHAPRRAFAPPGPR